MARLLLAITLTPLILAWSPGGFPNQLGQTPLRGWRSWQAVGGDVNQSFMEQVMVGLAKKRPLGPNGTLMSLADVGYADIGLDGGYFKTTGVNGSCHGADHHLLIDLAKFPSLAAMNTKAHSLNLTSSWYLNQDGCKGEKEPFVTYTEDSQDAVKYGFDGVKFDSEVHGPMHNITQWAVALNATGKQLMIENCLDKHPKYLLSDPVHCPFNFYRSGPDNAPDFLGGLHKVYHWAMPFLKTSIDGVPASRPGCFAYPDMLGIGAPVRGSNIRQDAEQRGCSSLSFEEEKTLFANWAIVSSPLVLGFDARNNTEVEKYWPIVANGRALEINAAWAGEPGMVIKQSQVNFTGKANVGTACEVQPAPMAEFPSWLVYKKRIDSARIAALAINLGSAPASFEVTLSELGGKPSRTRPSLLENGGLQAQDVWTGEHAPKAVTNNQPWRLEALAPRSSSFVMFHEL
jgi:hypothetical protein